MPDNDPTVLGLLVEGQARIEAQLTTGLAEFRGEMRGLTSRVEKLEQARIEKAAHERARDDLRGRLWTRREKAWATVVGALMVAGVWVGDILARSVVPH